MKVAGDAIADDNDAMLEVRTRSFQSMSQVLE
jgi:hypothetical protein